MTSKQLNRPRLCLNTIGIDVDKRIWTYGILYKKDSYRTWMLPKNGMTRKHGKDPTKSILNSLITYLRHHVRISYVWNCSIQSEQTGYNRKIGFASTEICPLQAFISSPVKAPWSPEFNTFNSIQIYPQIIEICDFKVSWCLELSTFSVT